MNNDLVCINTTNDEIKNWLASQKYGKCYVLDYTPDLDYRVELLEKTYKKLGEPTSPNSEIYLRGYLLEPSVYAMLLLTFGQLL